MLKQIAGRFKKSYILFSTYRVAKKLLKGSDLERLYFFTPIKWIIKRIFQLKYTPNHAFVNGFHMHLDEHDNLKLGLNSFYEPFETECVKKFLNKGGVAVDVGANIGYYTLLFAKLTGKEGKVYAFEPHPGNCEILRLNVKDNGIQNAVVENFALSDLNGSIELFTGVQAGWHSIYKIPGTVGAINIHAVTLDDYLANFTGNIDLVKIDVEGGELKVLRGMSKLLKNKVIKNIVMECNYEYYLKTNDNPQEVFRTLNETGYKMFVISEQQNRLLPITLESLSKNCNLLLMLSH